MNSKNGQMNSKNGINVLKANLDALQQHQEMTVQDGSEFFFYSDIPLVRPDGIDFSLLDETVKEIKEYINTIRNDESIIDWKDHIQNTFKSFGYDILFHRDEVDKRNMFDFVIIHRTGMSNSIFVFGWFPILKIIYHRDKDDIKQY